MLSFIYLMKNIFIIVILGIIFASGLVVTSNENIRNNILSVGNLFVDKPTSIAGKSLLNIGGTDKNQDQPHESLQEVADEPNEADVINSEKTDEPVGQELEIPVGVYRAEYFNSNNPDEILATEIVDNIAMNYPFSDTPFGISIPSKNFVGRWTGFVDVLKDGMWTFKISQSWSELQLIIDDIAIYKGEDSASVQHFFTVGRHKISVEYFNNWHTTQFGVEIYLTDRVFELDEIAVTIDFLRNGREIDVWAVSIYEPSQPDNSVDVIITETTKPTIIFLASYDSINWKLSNVSEDVLAIIQDSYEDGSTVATEGVQLPVFHSLKSEIDPFLSDLDALLELSCSPGLGSSRCSNMYGFPEFDMSISKVAGSPMTGLTTAYIANSLQLPEYMIDDTLRQKIQDKIDAYLKNIENKLEY